VEVEAEVDEAVVSEHLGEIVDLEIANNGSLDEADELMHGDWDAAVILTTSSFNFYLHVAIKYVGTIRSVHHGPISSQ